MSRPLAPNKKRSAVRTVFDGKSPQELVRLYDANGPSWVGAYLDDQADLVSLMRWRVQVWSTETNEFRWVESPRIGSLLETNLSGFQSERVQDFVRQMARELIAVGEVALVRFRVNGHPLWRVLPLDPGSYEVISTDKKTREPTRLGWPTEPGATKKDSEPAWVEADREDIYRVFRPDSRYVRMPTSPLWRILPDVRRFDTSTRALHRLVASLLRLNKILVIKGEQSQLGSVGPNGQEELGDLGLQIDDFLEASSRALGDNHETDSASTIPGIWVSSEENPLSVVDVGSPVDPALMDLKVDALNDAARGLPGPRSALVDGEGAAHRMLNDNNLRTAIYQSLRPVAYVIAHALTAAVLHPSLSGLGEGGTILVDGVPSPRGAFRVWPDEHSLTPPEAPSFSDLLQAVEAGVLSPMAFLERANLTQHAPETGDMSLEQFVLAMKTGGLGGDGKSREPLFLEALFRDSDSGK